VGQVVNSLWSTHHTDQRFDDFKLWIQAEFRRLGERIADLSERVRKVEERLERPILKG
jgi:hypothetical protein